MKLSHGSSRARVLLVDLEHDFFAKMTLLLEEAAPRQYVLEWAQTYAFAVNMTRRQSFDLCLVSLHLGHRNGIDLLVQMKAQHYSAPVVLLAGGDELDGLPVPRQVECLDRDRLTPAMLQQVLRDAMFQTTTEAGAPLTSPGELLVPAKHQPVAR